MPADRYRLYSEVDLERVVDDMARQAAAFLDATPTVLLGMLRRGAPLADRIPRPIKVHAPGAQVQVSEFPSPNSGIQGRWR